MGKSIQYEKWAVYVEVKARERENVNVCVCHSALRPREYMPWVFSCHANVHKCVVIACIARARQPDSQH